MAKRCIASIYLLIGGRTVGKLAYKLLGKRRENVVLTGEHHKGGIQHVFLQPGKAEAPGFDKAYGKGEAVYVGVYHPYGEIAVFAYVVHKTAAHPFRAAVDVVDILAVGG